MLGHAVGKSTDSPEQAKRGRQIYSDRCSHCHGLNMATASAAVFDLRTFPPDEKPRFVTSVTDGKRAMPAWGSVLKSEDVDALWAYVMTAKKK